MYKIYNLNELAQNIRVLKEDNTKNNLGEEIGLFALMWEIGFDPRDVKDFAEYSGLRISDSKKYNDDFEYKNSLEKTQFKKYLHKKIEKLSGIIERLEVREPRTGSGETEGQGKESKRSREKNKFKTDAVPPRSNEKFGIALRKIINYVDVEVKMLSHLVGCEAVEIQSYLTGEYKNPSKELIEEIASFFSIDPRHFSEYRKYLGEDYKEDRPITLEDFRITKRRRELFELPEQSDEEFKVSFRKIVGASGMAQKELANTMNCSESDLYKCTGRDYHHTGNHLFRKSYIEKVSKFFNIDSHYFKEYRENETTEKILTDVIKYTVDKKKDTVKHISRDEIELQRRERKSQREKIYRKKNLGKMRKAQKKYSKRNPDKIKKANKRFRDNNPGYSKEYYRNNLLNT